MKMASQRFCLRWNNHQSNLLSVFDQLLHAETFTDVTLAVDGQYLKAHKMVLSACSPYFNALFINHPEKHPIVILKDVPYSDMKSLLDFMYRGEVSVDQERLTAFLRVAESLRIKGLTEVNDDKPSGGEPTPPPPPPQLQRIQPYLVQQQQQRNKAQSLLNTNNNSNINNNNNTNNNNNNNSVNNVSNTSGNNSNSQMLSSHQQQQHQQTQHSLLSSALASMPKRKRGRPRKLSGSSNGTGNDYDEYDRDGTMNDSELGESKLGNDSFSGNDDASDDNQRESCDNDQDLNESHDSITQPKKAKQSKDLKTASSQSTQQHNDNDNSTSVQLINASPELSQRLFGSSMLTTTTSVTTMTTLGLKHNQQQQQHSKHHQLDNLDSATHLPTALGLKIQLNSSIQQQQQQQQQKKCSISSSNSLLKQQLRSGLKDLEPSNTNACVPNNNTTNSNNNYNTQQNYDDQVVNNDSCSALQSLANAAERQAAANAIKPPTASNLHHQFLLHMAANPMLNTNNEYFQHEQQQQSQPQQQQQQEEVLTPGSVECMLEPLNDNRSDAELTLADDSAGLGYKSPEPANVTNHEVSSPPSATQSTNSNRHTTRPVQRRRIRRKAQSSLDDQAEHLTEMSVRGLDLFRYASINEGVYQCTECAKEDVQKTFKNKYSFQRHAFLYHEGKHRKVFPCPVCGKEFSRPDKMKNHMKMTHESFVSKQDLSTFHPLNYLISAAAAGEIHSTLFSTTGTPQTDNEGALLQEDATGGGAGNASNMGNNLSQPQIEALSMTTPVDALLKLQQELIIKNEYISPSPSPPPETSKTVLAQAPMTSEPPTQRLEEVK